MNIDKLITSANSGHELTDSDLTRIKDYKVDNAIILAAGFGSRFVPITFDTPKGLVRVLGEPMVERQIRQLHEAGITDITLVVGYLKEKFEYLIDKYGVKLIYNPEYSVKNSLSSLYLVRHLLKNTYVLVSDNWLSTNIYNTYEPHAWYCSTFMKGATSEWCLITDEAYRITDVEVGGHDSYVMYGPAYFDREFSAKLKVLLEQYYETPGTENYYWEHPVKEHINELNLYCNPQPDNTVYEFENLEELRLFDDKYTTSSGNRALEYIAVTFNISESEITGIKCLKSDNSEKAFSFNIKDVCYICRIKNSGNEFTITKTSDTTR